MDAKINGNKLTITLELGKGQLSGTGKMYLVASTGGFKPTGLEFEGHPISVNVMAGYKNKG